MKYLLRTGLVVLALASATAACSSQAPSGQESSDPRVRDSARYMINPSATGSGGGAQR